MKLSWSRCGRLVVFRSDSVFIAMVLRQILGFLAHSDGGL